MRRPVCKGRQRNDFSTRSAGTFRVRRFLQMTAGRDQQANGTVPMEPLCGMECRFRRVITDDDDDAVQSNGTGADGASQAR